MPTLFPQSWPAADRQYLYNLALAIAPLLVAFGLINESQIGLILGVIGAALGFTGNLTASRTLRGQRDSGLIE